MSTEQMRIAITGVYPWPKWKQKVARMHDYQVIAIYYNFLQSGKFDKPKQKRGRKKLVGVQLDMFDVLDKTI